MKTFKIQGTQLFCHSTQKTWSEFSGVAQRTLVDSLEQREGKYFG